ncbi:hypothetical protein KDU71_00630 [Carboxylicivirga sediminis]|uniref:Holin of 3TMs, for gene-transfer release n=1 Tax=Carboxylicivirga sediminis TaxID=2006564 RepID=A0A941F299_9BACT|nr:hypothetical protein [Carboxylicivirga sediminis]MBR8534050.1 hypothetical protein [Carboxylicivirga sediminis]
MKFLEKVTALLGNSVFKDVGDLIDRFVTTGAEKQEIKKQLIELQHRHEVEAVKLSLEAEQEFNQRIKDLEGTAKDLHQSGWLGKLVLFMRGAQRPSWGYFVAYMDYMVFAGNWSLKGNEKLESAFWIINFLVLGFLFGERAVKNVAPLVSEMMGKKK